MSGSLAGGVAFHRLQAAHQTRALADCLRFKTACRSVAVTAVHCECTALLLRQGDSKFLINLIPLAAAELLPSADVQAGLRRVLDGLPDAVIDAPKAPVLVRFRT